MKYYVYLHLKEDTLEPFYVGKGKGDRALFKYGRSQYWKNIADKHGWLVKIIMSELNEESALALEIETIKNLKELNINLCNLTEGGEGVSGHKHSEEARAKMSEAKIKNPTKHWLNNSFSEEHLEKIKIANAKKKGISTGKRPPEVGKKISEIKKGKPLAQITCPHCNKTMSKALEIRHNHIEKCKEK